MNNYSEQIFQSIDTIISQRLNEVKFDRTITCEVIAGVEDYPNKYWVSDGATKFQACVADSSRTYMTGQKVYVLIPNGDYNNTDKVIIGSYTADELPKNLYVNPFNHLVYSSKLSFTIDNTYIETSIDTANLVSIGEQEIAFNYSNTMPFDYIGLDFSFNTTDLYGMKQGNYGIQFTLKNGDKEIYSSAIDSSQLYGDIYNFNSLMKMQHLFPIPTEVDITQANKLEVNLYQNGNFDIAKKKIYLKSATFYFGYDVEKIDSNKLILYLDKSQSLTFKEGENLTRKLYLEWQDTDLNKIYNSKEKPSNDNYDYIIYWCKYTPGYAKNEEDGDITESGVYWKTINNKNQSFVEEINLDIYSNTQQYKVGVKYIDKKKILQLQEELTEKLKAIQNNTKLTEEEKAAEQEKINKEYGDLLNEASQYKYLESNALIFSNIGGVQAEPGSTNNSEDSIKLTCSDSGVYNYYTSYGKIIDSKYKNLERTIEASFLDGYDIADTSITVKWSIVGVDENNQNSTMINQKASTNKLFTFTLKDNYIPGIKDQNTILCEATLSNGEIRRGKITLRFGEANSAGSQYAFNINFPDNVNCLYIGDTTPIEIKYTFESRSGETIEAPAVTWSWLDEQDHGNIVLDSNKGTITAPSAMPNENHAVLVATIKDYPLYNGLQTDLKAYLPIPLSADKTKYQYMSGPTYLVYDSTGSAVLNYSKENYVLYPVDESEEWRAEDYTPNTPQLSSKNGKWYLQPLALAPNELPVTCLKARKNGSETIIWSQPIFSTRERWDMDALNNWNGTFLQDIKKNRLFAATIAAGGKNAEDNTFSGVLMGQSLDPTNKTLEETGLYGIDKGIVKFYLNNAGAFFVGDGDNYISFNDKNKGTRDAAGNATFAVNVNKLLLNTPQTKIISSKLTDDITDTDALRVKLGWIKDDVYGLDIYNGAFRMYGVPWKADLTDEDANIYFKTEDNITNMYIRGKMLFSADSPFTASPINISQFENILFGGGTMEEATEVLYGTKYNFYSYGEKYNFYSGLILNWDGAAQFWTSGLFFGSNNNFLTFRDDNTGSISTIDSFSISSKGFGVYSSDTINIQTADGNITIGPSRGAPTTSGLILGSSGYTTLTLGTWTGSVSSGTTSDSRYKNSITELSSAYSTLFDNLTPKKFKYNDGTSNRFHTGFIAQDVNEAIKNSGLTTQDFAATILLNKNKDDEHWALRYEEFIALNTWQIQKLKQRVTELENEIKEIKQNENN